MAKKPDLGDISTKLNISGIISNVKAMISPGGITPNPEDGDVVGMQLAELSLLIQELAGVNSEQAKRLAKVNQLFNGVFNTLKAERDLEIEQATAKEAADAATKEAAEAAAKPAEDAAADKAADDVPVAEADEKPKEKAAAKKEPKSDET